MRPKLNKDADRIVDGLLSTVPGLDREFITKENAPELLRLERRERDRLQRQCLWLAWLVVAESIALAWLLAGGK